jgi:hypothetical protein
MPLVWCNARPAGPVECCGCGRCWCPPWLVCCGGRAVAGRGSGGVPRAGWVGRVGVVRGWCAALGELWPVEGCGRSRFCVAVPVACPGSRAAAGIEGRGWCGRPRAGWFWLAGESAGGTGAPVEGRGCGRCPPSLVCCGGCGCGRSRAAAAAGALLGWCAVAGASACGAVAGRGSALRSGAVSGGVSGVEGRGGHRGPRLVRPSPCRMVLAGW